MNRTAVSLAILALGLAACTNAPRQESTPRIATQELPFRPGQGVVIAAMEAPAPVNAAAGGTTAAVSANPAPYRLAIRMDGNRAIQYVDTDNREIAVGSRVELGADHTIRKL